MLMDIHPRHSAVHTTDFCSIPCSMCTGREKGNGGGSGLYSVGGNRDSGICRIYTRACGISGEYGRLYYRIYFIGIGYVGNGSAAWEKAMGSGGINGNRPGGMLYFWYRMVYDGLY